MAIQELPKNVQSLIRSSISVPSVSQAVIELVLNSIDAGATSVDVYIDLKYFKIRVVDNGCGMTRDQLDLICGRYMTSKCHSVEELKSGLHFFGFRGEALASIRDASGVLSIISKHGTSTQAYSKMFVRGVPLKISPYKINKLDCGTTVIVQDFMYNLPVRQKCTHETLDVEEIKRQLECIALMHPQISFSLHDECKGCTILQKHRSADLQSCFSHLFGMTVGQTLASVEYKTDNLTICGYIGKEPSKYKNLQFVYVNKRVVLNTKIHQLVNNMLAKSSILRSNGLWRYKPIPKEMGSKSLLSMPNLNRRNKFGVYVLNLHCPHAEYDICFDPKKTVIEFRNWKHILNCFEECVRQFLEKENLVDSSLVEESKVSGSSPLVFLEAIEKETSENQTSYASSDEEPFTLHIKRAFHGVPARRGGILAATKLFNNEDISYRTTNNPKCSDKFISKVAAEENSTYSCNKFLKKQQTLLFETGAANEKLSCNVLNSSTDIFLASNTVDPKLSKDSEVPSSVPVILESDAVSPHCNSSNDFTVQQNSCSNSGKETSQKKFYSHEKEMTVSGGDPSLESCSCHKELRGMNVQKSDDQTCNNCLETENLRDENYMTTEEFVQTGNNMSKQNPQMSTVMSKSKLSSKYSETQRLPQKRNHQSSREKMYFPTSSSASNQKKYYCSYGQMPKIEQKKMKGSEKHSSFMNSEEFIHAPDEKLSLELHEKDEIYPSMYKRNQYEHVIAGDEDSPSRSPVCNITQGIKVTHCKEEDFDESMQNKAPKKFTTDSFTIKDNFCVRQEVLKSPYFTNDRGFFDSEMKVTSPNSDATDYTICEKSFLPNSVSYHSKDDTRNHFNNFVKQKENRKRASYNECDTPSEKQRLLEVTRVTDVINPNSYFDESYYGNLLDETSPKEKKISEKSEITNYEEILINDKIDTEEMATTAKSCVNTTQTFCHYSPEEEVNHSIVNEKLEEIEIPQQDSSNQITNGDKENEVVNKSPYWLQQFDSSGKVFYVHSDSGVTTYSAPPAENDDMKYTVEGRYSFLPKGLSPGVQSTVICNKSCLKPGTRQELHKMLLNDDSSTNELAEAKWRSAVGSESGDSKKLVKKLLLDAESRVKHSRKPDESLYEKKLAKLAAKVSQIMYPTEYNKNIFDNMHVVGQCDKKFIIVYCSLVEDKVPHVIGAFDQHAVHERIRLETLMKGYTEEERKHTFKATKLESDIVLPLNSKDCRIMKNFEEEFRRLGISYEVLNNNCVSVKKVPTCLYNREMRENSRKSSSIERFLKCLISDHAEVLLETRGACFGIPGVLQEIINYEACRGAIKFGEELALEECKTLVKNLAKCDQPFMCAHGRPTFGVIFDVEQMNKTVKVAVNKLGLKT